jgi:hypothetical protein
MKLQSLLLTIVLGLCGIGTFPVAAQESQQPASRPKQVRLLTVGNSFSRNATRYLHDLAQAGGHRLIHRSIVVGGASLQLHADKALVAEGNRLDTNGLYADGTSLQQNLQAEAWDYVTIQQASIKSHDVNTFRPYAGQLQALVQRYAPMAELLIHQTWAYRSDDPRFASSSNNPLEPSTQADMYEGLTSAYKSIEEELHIRRIPVGDAFFLADSDPDSGYRPDPNFDWQRPEYPQLPDQSHSLHVGWRWQNKPNSDTWTLGIDGHHASAAGEYLAGCVWYEILFEESSVGNPFRPQDLDEGYVAFLQQTAQRAVAAAKSPKQNREPKLELSDPQPQRYQLQARASQLDARTREYPDIGFVFGSSDKPLDLEHAAVDTRVAPQGKLVVWLMGHNEALFERLNSYGLHAVQVSYANKWFGKLCRPMPKNAQARGDVRLEAATGLDFSDELDLARPDGMMERAHQLVQWAATQNPQGGWDYFLRSDGQGLRWDRVIISGSSHGSTTAARFAKHQRVDRVVMLCGPRDQDQDWQANPSATPANRYFGFSHVLDGGWSGDHYCRSWEMLGMHQFGPIVNVDLAETPFEHSRRLISAADVQGDADRAHSSVTPGRASPQDEQGRFQFEPVWHYLYNHPVDQMGVPTERDADCQSVHVKF